MMTKLKVVLLVLFLVLAKSLLAEEKMPEFKEVKNIWPDEVKISKTEKEKIESEYKEKLIKDFGFQKEQERLMNIWIEDRRNINAYADFKKANFDLDKYYTGPHDLEYKIKKNAFDSQVIVQGKISNVIKSSNNADIFKTLLEISISEFIAGKEFLPKDTKKVTICISSGRLENGKYRIKSGDYINELKPGNNFIFFLTRTHFANLNASIRKKKWKRKNTEIYPYLYPENIDSVTTFSSQDNSSILIGKDNKLHMEEKKNLPFDLKEVKAMIKKIYAINKPIDFYKRSYK